MMSQSSAPLFYEFKKQASFFIKEKIKTARLALTDVTPAQMLTEEATSENARAPDPRTMAFISRAAFEVDDYWRVVDILHARLENFDKRNWRPSYNALIMLEHLMTHGPLSIAEEFQDEKSSIKEMQFLHHIDEKGFNWGFAVKKKAERVLELLDKQGPLLREERNRVRKVTREIQGFGSFSERNFTSAHGILQESVPTQRHAFGRSHSHFNEHTNHDDNDEYSYNKANSTRKTSNSKENLAPIRSDNSEEDTHVWNNSTAMGDQNPLLGSERIDAGSSLMDVEGHPFIATEKQSRISLLECTSEKDL